MTHASGEASMAGRPKSRTENRLLHGLMRSPGGVVGLILVVLVASAAVFAPWIATHDPGQADFFAARTPPAWHPEGSLEHLLGTDQLGQDLFSRIVYGARVSLLVGVFGALSAVTLGVTLGLLAGWFEGWVDRIVSGFANLLLSIPYLVLVIVVATVLGRSLVNVILLFGITSSPVFIRFARGEVLRMKRLAFVEAAQALGATPVWVVPRHLLPNLAGPLATLATFEISAMIFYEAGLGFLGLSVPPEVPSWGNMLSLGRRFLTTHPWMAVFPGLAIAVTTLGINLLGDWLRDAIDPRARERG